MDTATAPLPATPETTNLPPVVNLEVDTFDASTFETFRAAVISKPAERKALRDQVEAISERIRKGKSDAVRDDALRAAIGLHLLGKYTDALEMFKSAKETREKRFFQGLCRRDARDYAEAIADLEKAKQRGWDALSCNLEIGEIKRRARDFAELDRLLGQVAKAGESNAEWHALKGALNEAEGRDDLAEQSLLRALELRSDHPGATFRLAALYDRRGEEGEALRLYRKLAAQPTVGVNTLMNLALLLEDLGHYEESGKLLDKVLSADPTHSRAILFRKDVSASTTMVFDEEAEKDRSARNQVLEIPVTDFELSVRSRNCLKKMNIRTLGDLLHTTEQELLSYKNFGETSLSEIKEMLESKSLRLGQAIEEGAKAIAGPGGARARPNKPSAPSAADGILATPVTEIEFSVRSRKCLQRLGVTTLSDLVQRTEAELLAVKNFGQTSLQEIKNKLAEYSLSLRQVER